MKGIDVSSIQGTIDFAKVKASGVEIAYIKATEGLTYDNPTFKADYDGARAVGLKVGFYHYLRANDPTAEAQHFLTITNGFISDCKYAIDAEIPLGRSLVKMSSDVRVFADYLIAKGKQVCLYTDLNFYNTNLNISVKNIALWLADYCTTRPSVTSIGWQSTGTGICAGVTGDCDIDTFDTGILIIPPVVVTPIPAPVITYLVAAGNPVDMRAAAYLADFLKCTLVDATVPYDYSKVTIVYGVGAPPTTGGKTGWTTYLKKAFTGQTRFDTLKLVSDFITNGGK